MAETDQYVAFGTEYRALVSLPAIERARVWEPDPATVYFWDHEATALDPGAATRFGCRKRSDADI